MKRSCASVDGSAVTGEAFKDLLGALVDTNGRGFSFQAAAQAVMSAARSLTLRCAERLSFLVLSVENHRSTRSSRIHRSA